MRSRPRYRILPDYRFLLHLFLYYSLPGFNRACAFCCTARMLLDVAALRTARHRGVASHISLPACYVPRDGAVGDGIWFPHNAATLPPRIAPVFAFTLPQAIPGLWIWCADTIRFKLAHRCTRVHHLCCLLPPSRVCEHTSFCALRRLARLRCWNTHAFSGAAVLGLRTYRNSGSSFSLSSPLHHVLCLHLPLPATCHIAGFSRGIPTRCLFCLRITYRFHRWTVHYTPTHHLPATDSHVILPGCLPLTIRLHFSCGRSTTSWNST